MALGCNKFSFVITEHIIPWIFLKSVWELDLTLSRAKIVKTGFRGRIWQKPVILSDRFFPQPFLRYFWINFFGKSTLNGLKHEKKVAENCQICLAKTVFDNF